MKNVLTLPPPPPFIANFPRRLFNFPLFLTVLIAENAKRNKKYLKGKIYNVPLLDE